MAYFNPTTISLSTITLLCAILTFAIWGDIKNRRIPNRLVFLGGISGVLLNSILPEGNGLISSLPGGIGLLQSFVGLAVGLIVLLPFYALKGMGAGDVKLMAMIGAFVGQSSILGIILLTFLIGGILSILQAFYHRTLSLLFANLRIIFLGGLFKSGLGELPTIDAPNISAGKLPYAVPVGFATFVYITLAQTNIDFLHSLHLIS